MTAEGKLIGDLIVLLEKGVQLTCEPQIGIVFSGGIDSVVIAILAKKFSEISAYSVGVENSQDLEVVKKLREEVDFEIKIKTFGQDVFKKSLPEVMKILEGETNPLQISCALPIYLAAREAKKDGLKVMLSGQGADELFGGYHRYLRHLPDYEKLKEEMESNVKSAYQDNLNRDMVMCSSQGIELRFPFMNEQLDNFALEIPPQLKIKEVRGGEFSCIDEIAGGKFIRKYILRKAARDIGVPERVLNRPKKALQYGSGSWKILRKIAREEGFNKKTMEGDYIKSYLKGLNLE